MGYLGITSYFRGIAGDVVLSTGWPGFRRLYKNKIFYTHGYSFPLLADLLSGADGPLVVNGVTVNIPAGSIKRYSSVSIINSGILRIDGWSVYRDTNPGHTPTLIGCSGNFTIASGGTIVAVDNAGLDTDFYGDVQYSAPVIPFDSVVSPITYDRMGGTGGAGGETGGAGTIPGTDGTFGIGSYPTGHGGGGAGATDGGGTYDTQLWGEGGPGGDSTSDVSPGYVWPDVDNFGSNGFTGVGGEVGSGVSTGGGGGGGLRGISGGAIYIQIAGTATIPANSIDVRGTAGGDGGAGGPGATPDSNANGGGGGGGGAGGSGGYCWIRYKSGSVNVGAVMATGASGGLGGAGGIADPSSPGGASDGSIGESGPNGLAGGSSIATY